MPNINIKSSRMEVDENGEEVIVMEYDIDHLPGFLDPLPGRPKNLHGGHEHKIPFSAIWARMQMYGIKREEAIEECIFAVVEPSFYRTFPASTEGRKEARTKHVIVGVKDHAGKVRMPSVEEMVKVKQGLGLMPRRFRNTQEMISHFTRHQGQN